MLRITGLLFLSTLWISPSFGQDNLRDVPPTDPEFQRRALNVAEGFELNLFAADPMIEKPIQMTWDEQGRLWVIGSAVYPHLLPGQKANDKVFVLEDTDGDGQADKSTVFADQLLTPTGLLVGDGGAYVANSTEILHLRDLDGDGYAEDRRVVLRGFGADDTHHLIHSFRWGPDGMMYINQSIYIFSHIETPWGVRRLRQGGIWHYRTDNQKLDVFARGFVNPWGHSFDSYGQSFATDGAYHDGINHVFPGAAFVTAYQAERILKGLNPDQPKHAGLAIVSGRHMPDSLAGNMITNDFRANRVNRFVITDEEDGYVSRPASDLIWTDHVAFRPVDVTVGPDGAIYIADWYNPIIQHGEVDFRDPRRDHVHGRIWRVTAKDRPLVETPNLADASVTELLDMLLLPEQWTHIQARRLLRERGASEVLPQLMSWLDQINQSESPDDRMKLEALWLHQAFDVVNTDLLNTVLDSADPRLRAAGLRVLYHWHDRVEEADRILKEAVSDPHQRVRREAVTALGQRQSAEAAVTALDVLDHPMNEEIDFALWTTLRTLEPYWAPQLAENHEFLGPDLAQRVFAWKAIHSPEAIDQLGRLYTDQSLPEEEYKPVLDLIVQYGDAGDITQLFELAKSGETRGDVDQQGHLDALVKAASTFGKKPDAGLTSISALLNHDEAEIKKQTIRLMGTWELGEFAGDLETVIFESTDPELQQEAIHALSRMPDESIRQRLITFTGDGYPPAVRIEAAAAYIRSDLEQAAPKIMTLLNTLPEDIDTKPLFDAFYSQSNGHQVFEEALLEESIPGAFATVALNTYRGNRLRDKGLLEALEASGGIPPETRMPQTISARDKERLELDIKASGDPVLGEAVYRKKELACIACHAIAGAGGQVGPDLSSVGANAPTDYLIESMLEPEKAVKDGYALTRITRDDGQILMGTLVRETGSAVLLRDASDALVTVPNGRIEKQEILPGSLMPAGLTASLHREEFVNLVAFLSKLGEDGAFRVPTASLVRRWDIRADSSPGSIEDLSDADSDGWATHFGYVDGSLKIEEITSNSATSSSLALRFWVDVASAGSFTFRLNDSEGLRFIHQNAAQQIENNAFELSFATGVHPVVLMLDTSIRTQDTLIIEMRSSNDSARAQLLHAGQQN